MNEYRKERTVSLFKAKYVYNDHIILTPRQTMHTNNQEIKESNVL